MRVPSDKDRRSSGCYVSVRNTGGKPEIKQEYDDYACAVGEEANEEAIRKDELSEFESNGSVSEGVAGSASFRYTHMEAGEAGIPGFSPSNVRTFEKLGPSDA